MMDLSSCAQIAHRVRNKQSTAIEVVSAALTELSNQNSKLQALTRIFAIEAMRDAKILDQRIAGGHDGGRLAGVPFVAKDLFEIAGVPTTAGAKLRTSVTPATQDAIVVQRLKEAGAILVGSANMDEFAYGFATVNSHFGTTRNPHDLDRLAGGSSGGSAAAVASGMVPLSLGSDTNGSIRVPASLCGIWGIRPGDNAVPVQGSFPFVELLDTVGPFTRTVDDLAMAYEILADEKLVSSTSEPRVARLVGWFEQNACTEAIEGVSEIARHIGIEDGVDLKEAAVARSASFLLTAAQGGALHLDTLRTRAMEYDPAVRDRLLAGAMLPAAYYVKAFQLRRHFRHVVQQLFHRYDILIAPCTPVTAPRIDQATITMDGKEVSARANLGIYTQPLSLAGIPVVSAPLHRPGLMPLGIQFATVRGREGMLFELLRKLETDQLLQANAPRFATGNN